jgi:16S rRNA (cytosine967-C5)-methyltransferase
VNKQPRSKGKHPARRHKSRGAQHLSQSDILNVLLKIDASISQGYRADQTLSLIFKSRSMSQDSKRLLLQASAAWCRYRVFLPDSLSLNRRLKMALEMDLSTPEESLERLSLLHGRTLSAADWLPDWILEDLPADLDVEALALACLVPPSLWMRSHHSTRDLRRELDTACTGLIEHPYLPFCYQVQAKSDLYRTEAFHQGLFVLQDPASQAIGRACAVKPGEHWLDLCAGAGGKTLQLAQLMDKRGLVVACDIHQGRLKELKRRAKRMQVFNLQVQLLEGRLPKAPSQAGFDGVLVDAPCSNSGTLRRNPDLYHRQRPDIAELSTLQLQLLTQGATRLRTEGRLIYATCSLLKSENEEVIKSFLEGHPNFQALAIPDPSGVRTGEQSSWRMSPLESNQDATFVAAFTRGGSE